MPAAECGRVLTGRGRMALVIAVWMLGQATGMGSRAAGSILPDARIREVTVYPDRAEIVRAAEVDLPAGASRVEFANLPRGLEADSIRVTAEGVPATLGAVELRQDVVEPGETSEQIAARHELQKIEVEMAELVAAEGNAAELKKFVGSLAASTASREAERLAAGRADPASIQALYELIRARLSELSAESIARSQKQEELERRRLVAQARLGVAGPAGNLQSHVASVELALSRAGRLSLELRYVTPGASWRPAYRAALDPKSGRVELVSEGVVTQTMGEDWNNVILHLSTASPVRGVRPPELNSIYLMPAQAVHLGKAGGELLEGLPLLGRNYQDVLTLAEGVVDGVYDQEVAQGFAGNLDLKGLEVPSPDETSRAQGSFARIRTQVKPASIQRSAYNVSFKVPDRATVRADGREHRVALREESLQGEIEYRTMPSVQPVAFLVSRTRSPEDYPLLAGPVRVFVDEAYLGSFDLEETGPGVEFIMPFGVDNRVAVETIPVPDQKRQGGFFGKERRVLSASRTVIENRRDGGIRVIVEDRVPVTEDDRIRVDLGARTSPGWKEVEERPGVKRWELNLESGEKREIFLEYLIRFPRDLPIVPVRRVR